MKVFACACLVIFSVALVTAQNRYRPSRQRTRSNRGKPVGEGRTLGLIRPLLSLGGLGGFGGLGGLGGLGLGYDQPIAPYRPATAVRPQSAPTQADPFYGGGGYGGYPPYGYSGFGFKPSYGIGGFIPQFGGYYPAPPYGYKPHIYPGSYGGYGAFGGGYPTYPRPGYASPAAAPSSSGSGIPASGSSAAPPASALSGAQAAEVANLLGQLLGQQLRPIINGATASDSISADSSTSDERSKLLRRNY